MFFKKKITEKEAAAIFVVSVLKEISEAWPDIVEQLKSIDPENRIVFEDEESAKMELCLAVIAVDLSALINLFPLEQAKRLYDLTVARFDVEDFGDYARETILDYNRCLNELIDKGVIPAEEIGEILYQKWGLKNYDAKIGSNIISVPEPIISMALSSIVISHTGIWKRIKEQFKIVKG